MSVEAVLVALILSSVLASVFFGLTRALDALNGSGSEDPTPVWQRYKQSLHATRTDCTLL